MSTILRVRDLEKTFGSLVAAHDINVAVPPLQTVGIIGANGAGKTTFVNMITGHLRPSKGSIWFEDRDITGRPSREITRLGIARSFQVPQIFASLTVLENMCAATSIAQHHRRAVPAGAHAFAFLFDPGAKRDGARTISHRGVPARACRHTAPRCP